MGQAQNPKMMRAGAPATESLKPSAAVTLLMPRKGRGGKIIKGKFDNSVTLGTLAANTGLLDRTDSSVADRTYILSMEGVHSINGLDAANTVYLGVAHSDYSLAEVEEWIEAQGAWDEGDLVQQEISRRKIRQIGVFTPEETALNEGKSLKTKLGFILNSGDGLNFWLYNPDAAGLTTGAEWTSLGHVWLKPT